MNTVIKIERWEWPILKADPCGFDAVEITLTEPSNSINIKAIFVLEHAKVYAERLLTLCNTLEKVAPPVTKF